MARSEELNPRQRRFIEEYIVDLNGTQAAIRAGYSRRSAAADASVILINPKVQLEIEKAIKARSERTFIRQDRVVRELAILGFSDVRNYVVGDDGEVELAEDVPDAAFRAISSIRRKIRTITTKGGSVVVERDVELKLWNKNNALELLGKNLRMWLDKIALTDPTGEQPLASPFIGLSIEDKTKFLEYLRSAKEMNDERD